MGLLDQQMSAMREYTLLWCAYLMYPAGPYASSPDSDGILPFKLGFKLLGEHMDERQPGIGETIWKQYAHQIPGYLEWWVRAEKELRK